MYEVKDELSGDWIALKKSTKVVIQDTGQYLVYGYVKKQEMVVPVIFNTESGRSKLDVCLKAYKGELLFDNTCGLYFSPKGLTEQLLVRRRFNYGYSSYPYSFNREYEAVNNFKLFKNKQLLVTTEEERYKLSEYMPYTFGVEFETSQGFVPEDICFRDGLIPLRDGSITGLEYSTVVLEGNFGIALLKQQMETLRKYVCFNKDCALHVHIGGFPLKPEKIFKLYQILKNVEGTIENIIPPASFRTSEFKSNGKDYCIPLRQFYSFDEMYLYLVGKPYFGSLTQSHPCDIERNQKWKILTRYTWCNFINMLCYNVNKTVEFRFLRPTYNFKKLVLWLYIFNGLLLFAESDNPYLGWALSDILKTVYPEPIYREIRKGLIMLQLETDAQTANGDPIGAELWRDDMFDCLDI